MYNWPDNTQLGDQNMLKVHHSIETLLLLIIMTILSSIAALIPLWGNGLLTVTLPLIILISGKEMVPFERIKLSTLVVGRILVMLTALYIIPGSGLIKILVVLLYVNIMEAIISDFRKKSFFNVFSGLALIVTTHILFNSSWISPVVSEGGKFVHIGYYLGSGHALIPWVIAYTIWNWNFVIYEFPPSVGRFHIALLGVPLLFSLVTLNPGFWLLLRGASLTLGGVIQIGFKKRLISLLDNHYYTGLIEKVKGRTVQIILMITSVALCAISFILNLSA